MLVKVATILAALDAASAEVVIAARHVYRAQMIVEGWRASLHSILANADVFGGQDKDTRQKVLETITAGGNTWLARRELLRKLGMKWAQIETHVTDLLENGEIEEHAIKGKSGPASVEYRRVAN